MATVWGESGAWLAILSDLRARGLLVSEPEGLPGLPEALRASRTANLGQHRAWTMTEVARVSAAIRILESQSGIAAWLRRLFEVPRLRSQIDQLYRADRAYPVKLDADILRVESLIGSPELTGAIAERRVIEELRTLPDEYVVYNDLRLRADRRITFNGALLLSAQVDHAVVGPTGVFVIETKCWSRQFAQSGGAHDPFDQVSRASYLCYDLLRSHVEKVPVRSVVACAGTLLAPPSGSQVRACRVDGLRRTITTSHGEQLSRELICRLGAYLSAQR